MARTITHDGLTLTLDAWAERIGITGSALRSTSPGPRDTRLAAALDALRERRAAIHAELSELEVVISTLERHVGAAA